MKIRCLLGLHNWAVNKYGPREIYEKDTLICKNGYIETMCKGCGKEKVWSFKSEISDEKLEIWKKAHGIKKEEKTKENEKTGE